MYKASSDNCEKVLLSPHITWILQTFILRYQDQSGRYSLLQNNKYLNWPNTLWLQTLQFWKVCTWYKISDISRTTSLIKMILAPRESCDNQLSAGTKITLIRAVVQERSFVNFALWSMSNLHRALLQPSEIAYFTLKFEQLGRVSQHSVCSMRWAVVFCFNSI